MCLEFQFDMVETKQIGTNSRHDDMLISVACGSHDSAP